MSTQLFTERELFEIPSEILEAARKVELWMKQNGHDEWALFGIQSRRDFPTDEQIERVAKAICKARFEDTGIFSDELRVKIDFYWSYYKQAAIEALEGKK